MTEKELLVLVVDDEESLREILSMRVESWGYRACSAATAGEAEELIRERDPDVVLADLVLPDKSGLELLEGLTGRDDRRQVILMTAHGSVDRAVDAMKAGAMDFLTKPLDADKVRSLLDAAAEEVELQGRARELEDSLEEEAGLGPMVGASDRMSELFETVQVLAESDASAFVTGESGTGKELVARTVHGLSARAEKPFVAVNASAIPEGLIESELFGHEEGAFTGATDSRRGCFEQADGGTLLLDEITEMPLDLQPKLLRVLEEESARRVGGEEEISFDVRILAATNRDPAEAVQEGDLREDLFYRLNVFRVSVPPLRQRLDDLPLLAQHFVRTFNDKHGTKVRGLRPETLELLADYPWPGNVRELRNVVERATIVAESGWIDPGDLPPYVAEGRDGAEPRLEIPVGTSIEDAERELILRTLEHVDHNKAEAARRLGVDPKTVRNKLKRYGKM